MKQRKLAMAMIVALCATLSAKAQSKLYPTYFDLQEVTLTDQLYAKAEKLNYELLFQYDRDRLLTPYMRQAGFTDWEKQHPNFQNWGSGTFRLDGHVGGHYLSALAMGYASSHDEATRKRFLEGVNYMVDRMAECQAAFDQNTEGLRGYIGGLPDNNVWTHMAAGNLDLFNRNRGNVPFYVLHKVFAGLRDAYVYAGNQKALECFLKICDWGINVTAKLTPQQMQSVLDCEHGGINEVYADAYRLSGDKKYLEAAHRFAHRTMVDNMQTANNQFLSGKHANTQVPKYVGFLRTAQEDKGQNPELDKQYRTAAQNFWDDVVHNRTTAIGGNSIGEHFMTETNMHRHITEAEGPESCNTNNMLKLTEDLFVENPKAELADFYENAMMNHILSSQNPTTGGYVYFTSLRPQHFRVYSQVNQGMWCCVGTGMENHNKYGMFIYSRAASGADNTLYVNLFVASQLNNEKFALSQNTKFPYEPRTELTIDKAGKFTLAIRKPQWCKGFSLKINGKEAEYSTTDGGYAAISRKWKKGDKVSVELPMELNMVECPGDADYVAFRYGPVLLAAITSRDNLEAQFAGEGRMDHSPGQGIQKNLTSAPMLIGARADVLSKIQPVDKEKLIFKIDASLYNDPKFADLMLQPFFTLHEARYMIYWCQLTADGWRAIEDQMRAEAAEAQRIADLTIDYVATGEQQSDAGHALEGSGFEKGMYWSESYIHVLPGNEINYQLVTKGESKDLKLRCRFHSGDAGRHFIILLEGEVLADVTLQHQKEAGPYNIDYEIPERLLLGADGTVKPQIRFTLRATENSYAGGLYELRLMR